MTELLLFERIKNDQSDFESLLALKSEDHDIFWSGYDTKPDTLQFSEWYQNQLIRKDRTIWLVKEVRNMDVICGYLYISQIENEDHSVTLEISHGVSKQKQANGIGSAIVNFAVNMYVNRFMPASKIQAWVLESNVASAKTFLDNGFKKSSQKKEKYYSSMKKLVVLENFFFEV